MFKNNCESSPPKHQVRNGFWNLMDKFTKPKQEIMRAEKYDVFIGPTVHLKIRNGKIVRTDPEGRGIQNFSTEIHITKVINISFLNLYLLMFLNVQLANSNKLYDTITTIRNFKRISG